MAIHHLITPQRLIRLANDLLALEEASVRGAVELQGVPTLTSWTFVDAHWKGMAGYVHGHPKLGAGRVVTTPLVALDTDLRWARTFNTIYRLEPNDNPFGSRDIEMLGDSQF